MHKSVQKLIDAYKQIQREIEALDITIISLTEKKAGIETDLKGFLDNVR